MSELGLGECIGTRLGRRLGFINLEGAVGNFKSPSGAFSASRREIGKSVWTIN